MVRRPMVGADIDPPLTAPVRSGTAGMTQIVLIGLGAGAADGITVRIAGIRLAVCACAFLSLAFADSDGKYRMELLWRG